MNQTDLHALLADAPALPRSTTVFREGGLRGILLHLRAGESLPEHQARGAISVHCLQGEVAFSSGGETANLRMGGLVSLAAGSPHALVARQDSVLLVSMSEPVEG